MAIILITLLALFFGIALGYFSIRFRVDGDPIVEQIEVLLPQTQCAQCGYPGCRPYAEAIAKDGAEINLCPPGGEDGIKALADLLGREVIPLNSENGSVDDSGRMVAVINEETCIGCTKCVQICPVDAIVGAAKHKHNVIDEYCTGCKLCIPPLCPVDDCIEMRPVELTVSTWKWSIPAQSHTENVV